MIARLGRPPLLPGAAARPAARVPRLALRLARSLLAGLALAAACAAAGAAEPPPPELVPPAGAAPLTLQAAVAQALESNPALSATRHAERAAVWAQRQARAQLLPSISLESAYTRLDDETVARANVFGREFTMYFPDSTGTPQPTTITIPQTVFRDGYQTSVSGQVLLFHPALWNGVSLAGAARDLAETRTRIAVEETAHRTIRSFVELLRLRSLARLQERFLGQARDNAALAERLRAVGRYAEADVLRWRVEEARQSGILQQQSSAVRIAALTLANLVSAPPDVAASPDTTLPRAVTDELARVRAMDEAAWGEFLGRPLETVVAASPQLVALEATAHLADLQHRQSATTMLPSLSLAGSYGWQNNDTPALDGEEAWSLTAALSVPLFTSLAHYSGLQSTRQKALEARASVEEGRRGILLAAEAARTAMRSATEQLRLAETSRASARRSHELQRESYALGRLSNLEWIDANLALRASEQDYASAYYDLVLAIADYRQATGGIFTLLED